MAVELNRGSSNEDIIKAYNEGVHFQLLAEKTERSEEAVQAIVEAGRAAGQLGVYGGEEAELAPAVPEEAKADDKKEK